MTAAPAYQLDLLGWLQFERLCELVLEREAGLSGIEWRGHADEGRVALVNGPEASSGRRLRIPGPAAVAVVWVGNGHSAADRLMQVLDGVAAVHAVTGFWWDQVLVLTNLDAEEAKSALRPRFAEVKRFIVLGARELGQSLDRDPELRVAMPSVLGLRDLDALIDRQTQARSSLEVNVAQDLARVFWPTRAYERARGVLSRHKFVVLTGPPEMGKTAIARMLALARMTDGWEAHECNSPDQVWQVFDAERSQVFVADDAFGSTEYRADAADRWARELARILAVLDDRHWLIWTSRPAPLKAGLRRVHRERGAERFPSPGEVLVDASDLDLSEKTLILFRHAKSHGVSKPAREILRSAGVTIVEHPHFTPERIRRMVSEHLDDLSVAGGDGEQRMRRVLEGQLAEPTEAMRNSFQALEAEHRELLVALLDAPAGLIDERELAATARRHHAGGLSRPPAELIDRLTDHFLRVTPLGIGWVHPSWRDLVIGELGEDAEARRRFLSACGIHGVMLALSREGGVAGERVLPLLVGDRDWDTLGDRIAELLRDLDDHDLARLLTALEEALRGELDPAQAAEAHSLANYVLAATRRSWLKQTQPLPVFLLEAWYRVNAVVDEPVASPPLRPTWTELHPPRPLPVEPITRSALAQLEEWLALAQILARHDPDALSALRFETDDHELLGHLAVSLSHELAADVKPLAARVLEQLRELAPDYSDLARHASRRLSAPAEEDRWWVPHDLSAPPSTEPVTHEKAGFTRSDVTRVLNDL